MILICHEPQQQKINEMWIPIVYTVTAKRIIGTKNSQYRQKHISKINTKKWELACYKRNNKNEQTPQCWTGINGRSKSS